MEQHTDQNKERTFRDRLSIVSDDGKRIWIHAKRPNGKLYSLRLIISTILIAIFFLTPYFKIGGKPLFLFDILSRKFILFSKIFWPQDFFIFFLAMITFILFILLFTVIFGRVWCGWGCPQSVFMEMIFRNIEWIIEGKQIKKKNDFSVESFFRKGLKHIIFWLISFWIAATILSYINGYEHIFNILKSSGHSGKFIGILIFSTVIYIIFSQIRELVCTILCPYGRLQGVLLDKNSIAVSYDFKRGEPRGKTSQGNNGDCIDCGNCINVCPSGIDIRNGIQLECTNCTACIDACNLVMKKTKKPNNLIRYASLNNLETGRKTSFNLRMAGYTAILIILLGFLSYLLISRKDIQTTILRTPGTLFQELENGKISNLYNIKILNKTHFKQSIELKILSPQGQIKMAGDPKIEVKEESSGEGIFFIILDKKQITSPDMTVNIDIYSNNILSEKQIVHFKSTMK